MATTSLQQAARRAGFAPVPVSLPRRPGRPQCARDRQQRAIGAEHWTLAMELMRERYGLAQDYEREKFGLRPILDFGIPTPAEVRQQRKDDLVEQVLENEKQRHDAVMRQAEMRRYRKGPKPAPMLVRRRKA